MVELMDFVWFCIPMAGRKRLPNRYWNLPIFKYTSLYRSSIQKTFYRSFLLISWSLKLMLLTKMTTKSSPRTMYGLNSPYNSNQNPTNKEASSMSTYSKSVSFSISLYLIIGRRMLLLIIGKFVKLTRWKRKHFVGK